MEYETCFFELRLLAFSEFPWEFHPATLICQSLQPANLSLSLARYFATTRTCEAASTDGVCCVSLQASRLDLDRMPTHEIIWSINSLLLLPQHEPRILDNHTNLSRKAFVCENYRMLRKPSYSFSLKFIFFYLRSFGLCLWIQILTLVESLSTLFNQSR